MLKKQTKSSRELRSCAQFFSSGERINNVLQGAHRNLLTTISDQFSTNFIEMTDIETPLEMGNNAFNVLYMDYILRIKNI